MLTHDNLASNSLSLVGYWGFTDKDVLIHALPIYHTHGLFVASNVTLFARASMIFLPKFDPELIIRLMARATVMMGVPTFYTRLLQSPALTKESTAHMRLFVSGSAPLLADTHREWMARTGHAVLERYGMTETNMNTSNPYEGERVPGAVGHALPGVSVRVTDPETGKELAREAIGMIEVKGPNVFKGYWRMPEKTKAEFRDDGFFITGDLGKIDGNGYVHILGRGKDLVISGGFNVYPKEIESEIDAMPGVIEAAVIGVPHADFGEGVTAVVVCDRNAKVDEASVLQALDGRLAKFKMPKRVIFVDELPRNAMGKVQKNILRDTYKGIYDEVTQSSSRRERLRKACVAEGTDSAQLRSLNFADAAQERRARRDDGCGSQQTDHKPAAHDKQITPERHLQRALRHRVRGADAERRGEKAGRYHQHGADQRDVAERER